MKVTFDIDADLYRALKVEADHTDRTLREIVTDALSHWLECREAAEDRAAAAGALEEYRRDGGTTAEALLQELA